MGDTQRLVAIGLLAAAAVAGTVVLFLPEGDTSLFGEAGRLGELFDPSAVPGILVLTALAAPALYALGALFALLRKGLGFVLGLVGGLAHANVVALIMVNDGKLPFSSGGTPFYVLCLAAVLGIAAGIVGMLAPPASTRKRSDVKLPPTPVISAENPNAFDPLASREPRPFKPDPPREFREFQVTSRPAPAPAPDQMSSWEEIPDEGATVPVAPPPPPAAKPQATAGAPPPQPKPAAPAAKPAAAPASAPGQPKPAAPAPAKPAAAPAKPAAPPAKPAAAPAAGGAKPAAAPAPGGKPAAPAGTKPAAPAGPAKPAAKPPAK